MLSLIYSVQTLGYIWFKIFSFKYAQKDSMLLNLTIVIKILNESILNLLLKSFNIYLNRIKNLQLIIK